MFGPKRRHHPDFEDPSFHAGPHFRGRGPDHERYGRPGGRARRGEARFVLLDILRDGPKHGYEIIKALAERSSGQYAPSPGTVYPTLQFLEDMGLLHSDQNSEKRVYHITEMGLAELEARKEALSAFWERVGPSPISAASQTEIKFLREEMEYLRKTVGNGVQEAMGREDQEMIRRVRRALERCRDEIRQIIADPGTSA